MNERFKKNAETNFKIMENFINDHDPMEYVNCYVLFEALDSLKPVADQINTKHIVNGDIASYFERHTLSTDGGSIKVATRN